MPKIGTLTKVLFHNAELIEVGSPVAPVPGSQQTAYSGVVGAIFYVTGDEYEPEHIDVLGMPVPVFKALLEMARGVDPEAVFKNMTAEATKILQETKKQPSGLRRVYLVGEGPVRFYESTLSIGELFEHYQDRFFAVATAYQEEDEDEAEGEAQASPANGQAAQASAGS